MCNPTGPQARHFHSELSDPLSQSLCWEMCLTVWLVNTTQQMAILKHQTHTHTHIRIYAHLA